jgi:hypothetical protein
VRKSHSSGHTALPGERTYMSRAGCGAGTCAGTSAAPARSATTARDGTSTGRIGSGNVIGAGRARVDFENPSGGLAASTFVYGVSSPAGLIPSVVDMYAEGGFLFIKKRMRTHTVLTEYTALKP